MLFPPAMLSALTFAFEMNDGSERLDPRIWKAVVVGALARGSEGLLVCDGDLAILFATPRAVHLLERLGPVPERGPTDLPAPIALAAHRQLEMNDPCHVERIPNEHRNGTALLVQTAPLRGVLPARAAIWLREELLRDDSLYAHLKERFSMTPRGFRLAQLVRQGLTNRQIASQLRLTESTVKVYLHQLYRECGVPSRTALIALMDRSSRC